jgi:hypothetical protein
VSAGRQIREHTSQPPRIIDGCTRAAVRFDDASSSELAMTILDSSTGSTVRPVDPWHATILDSIGDTPLIRVDGVWVKLEFLNPSGSIKGGSRNI